MFAALQTERIPSQRRNVAVVENYTHKSERKQLIREELWLRSYITSSQAE